ncbi:MAG TPA: pyridoxal-phosphate dependent enzyme [Candidatus Nanopelagicales bacterium]|nr:pyridoxal-phosphate dependent enzyme [Candidatus Nanopelagicales bacterium]
MALTPLPRTRLAVLPTPLQPAPALAAALGLPGPLLVKRDDLTGFALGGNKVRQLELLLGQARAQSADVVVTGGAVGSNFVTAAAVAAQHAGLRNVVVIAGRAVPARSHPNLAAALAWGAQPRWTDDPERASIDALLPVVAAELAAAGARPYLIPRGGANATGAAGFRLAFDELCEQLDGRQVPGPTLVVAAGSGGTLAGLVAGNVARGRPLTVVGDSVSRPPEQLAPAVLAISRELARVAGDAAPEPEDVHLVDGRGPGHGVASAAGTAAAAKALRSAGLVLDPVYTAKALAALPAVVGTGPAVFWHTGGVLDAVAELLTEELR